jgi:hypothetical protein
VCLIPFWVVHLRVLLAVSIPIPHDAASLCTVWLHSRLDEDVAAILMRYLSSNTLEILTIWVERSTFALGLVLDITSNRFLSGSSPWLPNCVRLMKFSS